MSSWFQTPKQKILAGFLAAMTVIFVVLTFWSISVTGDQAASMTFQGASLLLEEKQPSDVKPFTLKEGGLNELHLSTNSVDNNWLWVKAVIVDAKDRPVHAFDVELSLYHGYEGGEYWTENELDEDKVFWLGPGDYKMMIYAENDQTPQLAKILGELRKQGQELLPADQQRMPSVQATITEDIVLSRYFVGGLIFFALITLIYFAWRHEKSKYEWSGAGATMYDDDNFAYSDQGGAYDPYAYNPATSFEGGPQAGTPVGDADYDSPPAGPADDNDPNRKA